MTLQTIETKLSTSITDLKKNPMAVIDEANGEPVAVLNRNKPAFYCLTPELFELFMEMMDDEMLMEEAVARRNEKRIKVTLDEL